MKTSYNQRRVKKVRAIMSAYDEPELVRDLLADVMHYCDHYRISFTDELISARGHFETERVDTDLNRKEQP